MAISHPGLYKKGRFWYYLVTVNGQRAHGSTRSTDLLLARKILDEKRRELLDSQLKRPTRYRLFADVVKDWFRFNRHIFSACHLTTTECLLRRWVLPVIGNMPLNRIGDAQILELRTRMLDSGCSGTYANNTLRTIVAIFNFAVRLRYIHEVPFRVKKLKVQRKPRPILSAASLTDFFREVDRQARNPHIPVLLRVMVGLGLRESEALGMKWNWFNSEDHTYVVGKSKNREARVLPIPEWLWHVIHSMPKSQLSEFVFPAEDGKPHRPQFCKKVLKRACTALSLGNITQHRLRATFATLHAQVAGTPLAEVQGLLGHRNVQTTMLYIEQSLDAKRRAQDTLSQKLGLA